MDRKGRIIIGGLALFFITGVWSAFATTFYVDGVHGSDARPGHLPGAPKRTIQAAIDAASPGDIIRVAPGFYAPFEMPKRLIVIATHGPERTIIDGGEAFRCTFRQNYAWDRGGAMWEATAHHSLLHDNRCDNHGGLPGGAGAHGSHLYNCTVTRNRIGRDAPGAGGLHECWSYNCIVWDNHNPWYPEHHEYRDPHERQHDHWQSDPHFVGPDRLDFHLRHDSPCRRIGHPEHFPDYGEPDFHLRHPFDRDRNPRFHDDEFDLGCFEEDERFNAVFLNQDGSFEINYNPMA